MKKSHKMNFRAYIEKIRFKYKVSILNENTLAETFSLRLSRLNVLLLVVLLLFVTFLINSFIIIQTPLKLFLPGYGEIELHEKLIHTAVLVDSLSDEVRMQNEYITTLRNVISGDIRIENINQLDSIALKKREEPLTVKSKNEQQFVENFEKEEQYNISSAELPKNQNAFIFFKPAKGIVGRHFNPSQQQFGIEIVTAPQENVVSVLNGTVVFTDFTVTQGYVISIQHADGIISIYRNAEMLVKKVGETVRAGELIAFASNPSGKSASNSPTLHFELWQKGKPLNPEEYIIF